MTDGTRREVETWLAMLDALLTTVAPDVPGLAATMAESRYAGGEALQLPVLEHLSAAVAGAPMASRPVVERLARLAPALVWRQTYGAGEASAAFLRNYGWTELIGARGLLRDPAISAGLLLLGPDTLYPAHHHPALEYYVPLSGNAEWFDAEQGWRQVAPLRTIVHRSGIDHGMRTRGEPLLAYFHWSGAGVDDRARFTAGD